MTNSAMIPSDVEALAKAIQAGWPGTITQDARHSAQQLATHLEANEYAVVPLWMVRGRR